MTINFTRRRLLIAGSLAAPAAIATGSAWAASYPSRTITLIVPYTTGGLIDLIARVIAPPMSQMLKESVIVVNKPGAGSIVGTEFVTHAAPDGYTLLVDGIGGLVNQVIYKNLPYNAETVLAPISELVLSPNLVFVKGNSPIKSIHDLIVYCRSHPEKATYATAAPIFWLVTELFAQKTGLKVTRVSYKGSGGADLAVTSGEVLFAINSVAPLTGLAKSGAVRVLATTAAHRVAAFPDVPTLAEAGVSGISVTDWTGIWAPAKTSPGIVSRLNEVVRNVLSMPHVEARFAKLNLTPASSSSVVFKKKIARDLDLWGEVAKRAGISASL